MNSVLFNNDKSGNVNEREWGWESERVRGTRKKERKKKEKKEEKGRKRIGEPVETRVAYKGAFISMTFLERKVGNNRYCPAIDSVQQILQMSAPDYDTPSLATHVPLLLFYCLPSYSQSCNFIIVYVYTNRRCICVYPYIKAVTWYICICIYL